MSRRWSLKIPFSARHIVAILAVTVFSACGQKSPPPPPPLSVGVITLEPKLAIVTAEYVAQTEAFSAVEIHPRVSGILDKTLAIEGAHVHAGQVLFEVDPQPYQAALAQAKAALAQTQASFAQSKRDLARVQPLSLIDAVSQQELDAAVAKNDANKASVDAAAANVTTAQLNLGYTTVTSPIDGIMSRAQIKVGGLLTAYTSLLTTVYNADPMYVNFSVSEQRMLEVQRQVNGPLSQIDPKQRTFRLQLADGSEYEIPAKLNFIDPAVDSRTGTIAIRLEIPNPKGLLHAGQFARVIVAIDHVNDALLVPQRTIQQLQGKNYVWVVDKDGAAQQRDVKLGPLVKQDIILQDGVKSGDVVIVDGVQRLRPGTKVNPAPLEVKGDDPTAKPQDRKVD